MQLPGDIYRDTSEQVISRMNHTRIGLDSAIINGSYIPVRTKHTMPTTCKMAQRGNIVASNHADYGIDVAIQALYEIRVLCWLANSQRERNWSVSGVQIAGNFHGRFR